MEEKCRGCSTSIEGCINSRRCFMTGEYCSKQPNIQKERKKLHDNNRINAFVIMNFSNMSDVVYKWRIKGFIESLAKYLYIDTEDKEKQLHCVPSVKLNEVEQSKVDAKKWKPVKEINVVRADSNPASNYVICNRVCQQMQIADLVIVDVSVENTNVFYEFGMAVALGKLILPICYSESFYEMKLPNLDTTKIDEERVDEVKELEKHIGCYPWRKRLFEYYGIRYRSDKANNEEQRKNKTRYLDFNAATYKEYGFADVQYNRFPYHEPISENEGNKDEPGIGQLIYERLKDTYNDATYDHNTLVVYTMDGFLNEHQAGLCIINYYENMTQQMQNEHCFCGDRVGILVQENAIPEDVKDAKIEKNLLYSVGEIIHIGMNQATYVALKEKIKPKEFLNIDSNLLSIEESDENKSWQKDVERFVKEHIRNKSISIYPNNPVYVNRIKNGLQSKVLEVEKSSNGNDESGTSSLENYFCLYHVMLRTLKYTNEIVVDISGNSLQALFWLGAAHGSDIYAITVQHEETEKERTALSGTAEKKERNIFDVAGLWTAILRSHDTDGFYRQLALAQMGIEQHTKLMLKNVEYYEERLAQFLYKTDVDLLEEKSQELNLVQEIKARTQDVLLSENARELLNELSTMGLLLEEKDVQEARALESYYRDRFWKPMLKYTRLWIYLPQIDDRDIEDGEPRLHIVKWDVDAIAALSHYLSKRKIIGEYTFKTLADKIADPKASDTNFICVGDAARPLAKKNELPTTESLAEYISKKINGKREHIAKGYNVIHQRDKIVQNYFCGGGSDKQCLYKGFVSLVHNTDECVYTQMSQATCYACLNNSTGTLEEKAFSGKNIYRKYDNVEELQNTECSLKDAQDMSHLQLAQLILWRERSERDERVYFRVALTGASGPATLALATILVDDDQKNEIFNLPDGSSEAPDGERVDKLNIQKKYLEENMLSKLQKQVRDKFMEIYFDELNKMLSELSLNIADEKGDAAGEADDNQKNHYFVRVKYAAAIYLSTVLYRYFLPFLSKEDEYRICNGMQTYITSMMAANVSPFALNFKNRKNSQFTSAIANQSVKASAGVVSTALKKVLSSFRGVEALYQVHVFVPRPSSQEEATGKIDTRKVVGIKELIDSKIFPVNCLFIEKGDDTQAAI